MSNILAGEKIVPNSSFYVTTLQQAISRALNITPVIHCVYDQHDHKNYISEIRICFNKSLELVDCDGVVGFEPMSYAEGKVITNCDIAEPIYYPSNVPATRFNRNRITESESEWKFPYVNVYKLIQFVKWFTL